MVLVTKSLLMENVLSLSCLILVFIVQFINACTTIYLRNTWLENQCHSKSNWPTKTDGHLQLNKSLVQCPQQRVTTLNLSSMCLNGTIPTNHGNFLFLIALDLSKKIFHILVIDEVGHLHCLKATNLQFNQFSW